MGQPAARMGDSTSHGTPLAPGPGSTNVLIEGTVVPAPIEPTALLQLEMDEGGATLNLGDSSGRYRELATAGDATPDADAAPAPMPERCSGSRRLRPRETAVGAG